MNYPLIHVTLGFIKQHFLQTVLLIIGIAFGVALIVSVDIANQSASRSFALSKEILSTETTYHIVGSYADFDESLYRKLKVDYGVRDIAPVVEDYVNIKELDGRAVRLFGTDFFADLIFYDGQNSPLSNLSQKILNLLLTKPGTALISSDLEQGGKVEVGETIELNYGSRKFEIEIVGVLDSDISQVSGSYGGLVVTDISTAQELLSKNGQLSRIELVIDEENAASAQLVKRISTILPEVVELKSKEILMGSAKTLTRSFELNLTALSLLALFVGVFLIYNIVSFSVIQRRIIIGTLRSIGATRGQIFKMIIVEAVFIGIVGSLIGLAGGIILGKGIVELVTRSINDLYYTLTVTKLSISNVTIFKGLTAGILAALIAALIPAYEASSFSPINILRRSGFESFFMKSLKSLSMLGLAFIILGYLVIVLSTKSLILSLLSVFLVLFGVSLLVPIFTTVLMRVFSALLSPLGIISRMSPRNVVRSISRTGVAVASLAVAISVILSVSIMIGSFRTTVISWLDSALTADIFISMDNSNISSQAGLDPEILSVVENTAGVGKVATVRRLLYDSPDYGVFNLVAVTEDLAVDNRKFIWQDSDNEVLWQRMQGSSVLISESFAYKNNMQPGSGHELELQTDSGPRVFLVSGVYYDYGAQTGVVLISDNLFRKLWNDNQITSLGVYASDSTQVESIADNLRMRLSEYPNLIIRSNDSLKESAINTFDRTFTITSALRLLIAIVAFISVISALMALQLEREKEYGIYRAIGMKISQLRKMLFLENALIGITAGLFSLPVGLILSLILIYVINLRSFGWTLNFTVQPGFFFEAMSIALAASLLAGLYPAYLIGKENVGKLIREE